MTLSLFGSANSVRPGLRRTDVRTLRLAIAFGDHNDSPCIHRKSQNGPPSTFHLTYGGKIDDET
jgi:hypothetical protein